MESPPINSNNDPAVRQETVGLFEVFDVFISTVGQSICCLLGYYIYYMGNYFEFAMLSIYPMRPRGDRWW